MKASKTELSNLNLTEYTAQFKKAILSYSWDQKEQPKKDGHEDPLDALRYDVINWRWSDSTVSVKLPIEDRSHIVEEKLKQRNLINASMRRF